MARIRRIVLIGFIIALCVGCDQVTKSAAGRHLPRNKTLSFAGDLVRLDYALNKGGVLTFESHLPQDLQGPFFSKAVMALVGILLLYLVVAPRVNAMFAMALSLFCGGVSSNMLDRLAPGGHVVDFLNVGLGPYRTSIFNVADVAIVAGTILLSIGLLSIFHSKCAGKSK